jgi:GNAT superfamily N-acetyltransferase
MTTFKKFLSKEQILQSQAQSHEEWGEGTVLEARIQKLFALMELGGPDILHVSGLVDDANTLVCSLKAYGMEMTADLTGAITGVGLGAIFTPPGHRRKGYAEKLIKHVIESAKANGASFAFLFSDIDPGYYKKLGFLEFPAITWEARVGTLPDATHESSPLDLRRKQEIDHLLPLELYERSFEPQILRPHKKPRAWAFYRQRNGISEEILLLHQSKPVGFLSMHFSGEKMLIEELVLTDTSFVKPCWALVRLMAEKAYAKEVKGWIRPEFLLPVFQANRRTDAIPMIAPLSEAFDPQAFHPDRLFIGMPDYF